MKITTLLMKTPVLVLMATILSGAPLIAEDVVLEFDVRPVPVKTPPPHYPEEMKKNAVIGMVALRVTIDETGSVVGCEVAKSTHTEFEQPAIDAVSRWKFKPATKAGVAVKTRLVMPIKFTID